jgi:hypothetical protein
MTEFDNDEKILRPFYFMVVVWGEESLADLANFCIPCLLADGNLPSLSNRGRNRLLIATTRDDWEKLSLYKIFKCLQDVATPELIVIEPPGADDSVYDCMNYGYKLTIQRALEDNAYGILLTPDLLISNGSFSAVERHARSGKRVVLAAALRYGAEPVFSMLKAKGIIAESSRLGEEGLQLSISGRTLANAAVNGLHTETLRFEWDAQCFSPYFTGLPGSCWWRVEGEDGIVLHTSSWAPVLIDYGSIKDHDASTIDHWSIDGDYIYRNFGDCSDVYVVQDSDEMMMLSWTPMNFLNLSLATNWLLKIPGCGDFIRGSLLRDAFLGSTSDPLKRRIFPIPVRLHGRPISEKWAAVEMRSKLILKRHLTNDLSSLHKSAMCLVGVGYRLFALILGRWANRRRIILMVTRALSGDAPALEYLRKRARLYMRQLLGRSISG